MRIRRRLLHWKSVIRAMSAMGIKFSYAQNKEDLVVAEYFKGFKGTLLSIGENDGRMFSNVLYLILRGWRADLIEPSRMVFDNLESLHYENIDIYCHRVAIGNKSVYDTFHDAGKLLGIGDKALVSSLSNQFTQQWNIPYKKTVVECLTFADFMSDRATYNKYDLISIDAETMDWDILQQMDLTALGCKCLIIEHGGDRELLDKMASYCAIHFLFAINKTTENIIFARI